MVEDFGPIEQRGSLTVLIREHKNVFFHATDACSTCCVLKGDLCLAEKSLNRHKKQSVQVRIERMSAVKELEKERNDASEAIAAHRTVSTAVIEYYEACVVSEPQLYEILYSQFSALMDLGLSATRNDISRVAEATSEVPFDISSDFQQDKHAPAWYSSLQPGPKHFMYSVPH